MNTCQHCHTEFRPLRSNQRYCSVRCRQDGRKQYQRAYKRLWLTTQSLTYRRDAMREYRAKQRLTQGGSKS